MRASSLLRPSPAYVFRPSQIGRRLRGGAEDGPRLVTLPWGDAIEVDPGESVGSGIARLGVHELRVSEAMWRLAEPDDLALDVGANVGYFSSLLGRRAGRVVAFEPHPLLVGRLRANVARWPGRIEVMQAAASSGPGVALLGEPQGFGVNAGIAAIGVDGARSFEVETVALDEVVGDAAVGVCKIDVEGHEAAVLEGLSAALAAGRIRDLFFEDNEPLPTPVSERLAAEGFAIFSLRQRLSGVELDAAEASDATDWDAPTYLATRDPARARERLGPRGWRCLRGAA